MLKTLEEFIGVKAFVGFGVAGNQAEHLAQAGEANDFRDVVALENAPKGMFPWYASSRDGILSTNPLSSTELKLYGDDPLQPEPEIGLVVRFHYRGEDQLGSLTVLGFSAFNDCSRRIAAPKISMKKNWGAASQGIAPVVMPISDFDAVGGTIESYRLVCYLKRAGELIQYGLDTAVSDYCYFNETLTEWIVNQINTQQDAGPLEEIGKVLRDEKPELGVIGIGATCYTDFGNSESRFLKEGDESIVVAYDGLKHTLADVEQALANNVMSDESMIVLRQKVVR